MSLPAGTRVGPYEILAPIGAGGVPGPLITTRAAGAAEIIVVTNWLAELKVRAGRR